MSTGALLYPVGYIFLDDDGNPVASGKLYTYRTTTTTNQSTYSDSTLDTALANPIVLNSSGRCTTAIYGDGQTGFDYRLTLKTSADVQIWQYDDVVVDGADTATFASGSFTGSITGCDAAVTGTISYKIFANSAGTGKLCMLHNATGSNISGTSNTTAMTMTGLPAACTPTAAVAVDTTVIDNATSVAGLAQIAASGTTITFLTDAAYSATGFTNSGAKGLASGWHLIYAL